MDDLWVATNMMNTCSFQWLVGNHNDILCLSCHEYFDLYQFVVATNMLKTCSFMCFVCHHDDILDILHWVFFSSTPLIAARMKTNCSFQCLVCNIDHRLQNEIPTWLSHILMEFWCSHFLKMFHWIVGILTLKLHYLFIFLCCPNGAMTKNGHVIIDMLLFRAHTWFAWSLMFVGMVNSNSSTTHLPPLHGDEEQESRTTLFKGGEMM